MKEEEKLGGNITRPERPSPSRSFQVSSKGFQVPVREAREAENRGCGCGLRNEAERLPLALGLLLPTRLPKTVLGHYVVAFDATVQKNVGTEKGPTWPQPLNCDRPLLPS